MSFLAFQLCTFRRLLSALLLCHKQSYSSKEDYCELIGEFISSEYCNYYELEDVLLDGVKLHFILKPMYLEYIQEIYEIFTIKYIFQNVQSEKFYNINNLFKELIVEKMEEKVKEETYIELKEITSEKINSFNGNYRKEDNDDLENSIWDKISDVLYEKLEEMIESINCGIGVTIEDFNIDEMRYYFDITTAIDAALQVEDDYNDDDRHDYNISEGTEIRNMFER